MKKIVKNKFLFLIIGLLLSGRVVYAFVVSSSDISYDNSKSQLKDSNNQDVDNVKDAIDVLYSKASSGGSGSLNSNAYDEWEIWLSLANVDNPSQYNNTQFLSNSELMNAVMNNDNALSYMVNSTYILMPNICHSQVAMSAMVSSSKASTYIFNNQTWKNEILNSSEALGEIVKNSDWINEFAGDGIQSLIPVMTSNTTPSGVASSNSILKEASSPWKAFNGNNNGGNDDNVFHSANQSLNDNSKYVYLRYEFPSQRIATKAIWYGRGSSYTSTYIQTPKEYKFQASNDGATWYDLTDILTNNNNTKGYSYEVQFTKNLGKYKYYQMYIISSNDPNYNSLALDELELYGF